MQTDSFSDPAATGTETYAYSNTGTAATLRNTIQAEMVKAWGLADRGSKVASFYVLVYTSMPATLSEMAFISNPNDARYLGDANQRERMASAHRSALRLHYGFPAAEAYDEPIPDTPDYTTPFFTSIEMAETYLNRTRA